MSFIEKLRPSLKDPKNKATEELLSLLGMHTFTGYKPETPELIEKVRKALDNGADPNGKIGSTKIGSTVLALATISGRLEIMRLLIERGADVNAKDNNGGFAPLHYATWSDWIPDDKRSQTAKILLDAGADPLAVDSCGETPCDQRFYRKDPATRAVLDTAVYARKSQGLFTSTYSEAPRKENGNKHAAKILTSFSKRTAPELP